MTSPPGIVLTVTHQPLVWLQHHWGFFFMFPNITPDAISTTRNWDDQWGNCYPQQISRARREGFTDWEGTHHVSKLHMQNQHEGHVEGYGQEEEWGWKKWCLSQHIQLILKNHFFFSFRDQEFYYSPSRQKKRNPKYFWLFTWMWRMECWWRKHERLALSHMWLRQAGLMLLGSVLHHGKHCPL